MPGEHLRLACSSLVCPEAAEPQGQSPWLSQQPLPPPSSLRFPSRLQDPGKAVPGEWRWVRGKPVPVEGQGFPKAGPRPEDDLSLMGLRLEPGQRLGSGGVTLIRRFPEDQCCLPRKACLAVSKVRLTASLLLLQLWDPALGTQPWGPARGQPCSSQKLRCDGTFLPEARPRTAGCTGQVSDLHQRLRSPASSLYLSGREEPLSLLTLLTY